MKKCSRLLRLIKKSFFVFMVLGLFSIQSKSETRLRIGILPGGSPTKIQSERKDFEEELSRRLKNPVEIKVSESYEEMNTWLNEKSVDFSFLTARTFVIAEQKTDLKVLLKRVWDGPFYFSAIIANEKSKIKKLSQIKNKKIIFVDEFSTSGYLYPKVMLQKAGLKELDYQWIFSKNHESSIKMLSEGVADVAAVFADDEKGLGGAWTKFSTSTSPLKVRVLKVSDPIPNDPFCVMNSFFEKYPQITYRLMSELIDLSEDPVLSKRFSNILGAKSLSPATSKQYDPVREMIKELQP